MEQKFDGTPKAELRLHGPQGHAIRRDERLGA